MPSAKIKTIILKVAAPCNLNCTYCYEYNRGDLSWKFKPPSVSLDLCAKLGERIRDYCSESGISGFGVNLHGGEPMLAGAKKVAHIIDKIHECASPIKVRFGMQTNATLTSPEMVEVLASRGVNVGVSLDGDDFSNRYRVDHNGMASRDRTIAGISLLRSGGIFAGIQAVIDLDSEPEKVLDSIVEFDPPMMELTIPFGNYDNPPQADIKRYSLGDWLVRAFDHWVSTPRLSRIRIRILQDAIKSILTEKSTSDWFPSVPPGYLVVSTDGSYEGLDTLKVVGVDGRILNQNVHGSSIADALSHPSIIARADSTQLCAECRSCSVVKWCNGGYFPTRYGLGRGFKNPSVYCADLSQFFSHIAKWLLLSSQVPDLIRNRISRRLAQFEKDSTEISVLYTRSKKSIHNLGHD